MKYYLLIAFVFSSLASLQSCKEEDKKKTFWTWFKENHKYLHSLDSSNGDEKLNLIIEHLNPITKELSVEISKEQNGVRNLTISPEGDSSKFAIVSDIVNNAPKVDGWVFTAFRQPYDNAFILKYDDIKFDTEEMYFIPKIEKNTLDLIIYSNNPNAEKGNEVGKYGLIALDKLLGEYDCTMKVRFFDFLNIAEASNKSKLIPIKKLRVFVDSFYKAKS